MWIRPPVGTSMALGQLADVHRERAGEHDERLLLVR